MPPTKGSKPPIDSTARWSNAPSPGSPAAPAACPTEGWEKNNNWLHHRVAALNLRRLLTMGLTVQDETWVLT